MESAWQRWGWESFLRAAVAATAGGSFWEENPELPFLPIRHWEIWNEENIVTFANHPNPFSSPSWSGSPAESCTAPIPAPR